MNYEAKVVNLVLRLVWYKAPSLNSLPRFFIFGNTANKTISNGTYRMPSLKKCSKVFFSFYQGQLLTLWRSIFNDPHYARLIG